MYIFELIYKLITKKREKVLEDDSEEDDTACEHVFLPVDSTKKVFACTKCGMLYSPKR